MNKSNNNSNKNEKINRIGNNQISSQIIGKRGSIEDLTEFIIGTVIILIFGWILFKAVDLQEQEKIDKAKANTEELYAKMSFVNILNSEIKDKKIWQIVQDSQGKLDSETKNIIISLMRYQDCMEIDKEKLYAEKDQKDYCSNSAEINILDKNNKKIKITFGKQRTDVLIKEKESKIA